jgi:creatinine amidohydrolase
MHFADMTWRQVERYLESDDRVIVVVGSCEQHCGLSLVTDVRVPLAIAERVAAAEGILVAPPINFGTSPQFMAYPGTISVSIETMCSLLTEVVRSLYEHGFKRVFVLNGHGGNTPALAALQSIVESHHDLQIQAADWWRLPCIGEAAKRVGSPAAHGNWLENFTFTRIEQPEGEKPSVEVPRFAPAGWFRNLVGDGSFGGAYGQPDDVMQDLLSTAVDEVRRMVQTGW